MKRLHSIIHFFPLVFICLLIGCSDKESAQYENVKASKDIGLIDQYLKLFPDAPYDHLDTIKKVRQNLMEDSLIFTNLMSSKDAIERYEIENNYVKDFPNGIHIAEVRKMLLKDKKEAMKLEKILKDKSDESIAVMIANLPTTVAVHGKTVERVEFKVDHTYYYYGHLKDTYNVKIDINSGQAEIFLRTLYKEYKNEEYSFFSSNTYSGSWKSIRVKRGNRYINALDIECGDISIYTTESLDYAYINSVDERAYSNFSDGNRTNALSIYGVKKQ